MTKRFYGILLLLLVAAVALAGGIGKATDRATVVPFRDPAVGARQNAAFTPWNATHHGESVSSGVYTTLEGFYDYQSNGGVNQYIRVDSASGKIHVVYMMAEDSTSTNLSRRTAYAVSTDDGATWNNFANVRVPGIRSGFPSLDLLRGPVGTGSPLIANHNVGGGTAIGTWVYLGDESGFFTELSPVPDLGLLDGGEPIWAFVASGSNGEIAVHSSNTSTPAPDYENYITRTADFGSSWDPWYQVPTTEASGGRYPLMSNGHGRLGTVVRGDTTTFVESTNDGATWNPPVVAYLPTRAAGAETLGVWVGVDMAYRGDEPFLAMNTSRTLDGSSFFFAGSRIEVWSPTLGYRTAAPWDSLLYPSSMVSQTNHLALGYPAIATAGDAIVVAYQAFLADDNTVDTLASGRKFGEIFIVQSTDGGDTWSLPANITNTPQLDERYPSISKWNPSGFAYVTWQEDTRAGSHAFNDASPVSRSMLVMRKVNLNTVFPVNDISALAVTAPTPGNPLREGVAFTPKAAFRNVGLAAQTGIPVRFEILNAAQAVIYSNTQTIASLASAATTEVTFEPVSGSLLTYGRYSTRAIASNPGDVGATNDTTLSAVQVIPLIVVSGSYTEDFEDAVSETGGMGWYAAIIGGSGTPDWVRGTPAKSHIAGAHGGTKCYVTKLTGTYSDGQESALGSPAFDLSAIPGAVELEFYQNFVFEPNWDGAWLQYSTDAGQTWVTHDHVLGTGPTFNTAVSTGWYNAAVDSQVIGGAPDPPMWGDSSSVYAGNVNRWIRTTTLLPVGGLSDVRLRWYFSADGSLGFEGWAIDDVRLSPSTGVIPGDESLPKVFALYQNYPNPFNPTTTIKFALPVQSQVSVEVFNALGQRVSALVNGTIAAGYHSAEWNGTGGAGQPMGSGVYFVRFAATGTDGRGFNAVQKMMLLK
jgi:hypothetical protein